MIAAAPLTLALAFERHYLPFIGGNAAHSTVSNYRYTIKVWEDSGRASLDLRRLRSSDFSAFRDEMLRTRKPATVNRYLREIRAIVRFCVDNWFRADPTAVHIVAHKHNTTAVRDYLDRRQYLLDVSPRLEVPPEFEAAGTTQLLLF
jgi:site-specific recombinase XerD